MRKEQTKIVIAAVFLLALTGLAFFIGKNRENQNRDTSGSEYVVRSTLYGAVKGSCEDGVEVFYGIPYGAAPTGELRWQAPEHTRAWDTVRDCTSPAQMALQILAVTSENGEIARSTRGTEDCLKLDIYTKKKAEKLPVMVYLHGGNNQTGNTGSLPGSDIVNRDDCVFVTVDYRLGLLGFNSLPALTENAACSSGNYALLDMAAALQWVQDNIEAFGGDPDNVTVSGFSAGGRDVMAMLISPAFRGLFAKALVLSGGMTLAEEPSSARITAELLAPLVVEDGICEEEKTAAAWLLEPSQEVRSYLYQLSADRLVSAVGPAALRMDAFPQLFQDGVVLPETGFDGKNNYCNDVPVMMLTGTSEFSIFSNADPYLLSLPEGERETAKAFATKYGSELYRIFNTQLSAEKMLPAYTSPIYLGQINYGGSASDSPIEGVGSFHGIEIPMLSAQHIYGGYYPFNEKKGYQNMAGLFHGYLKNFLWTGDPNEKTGSGLSQAGQGETEHAAEETGQGEAEYAAESAGQGEAEHAAESAGQGEAEHAAESAGQGEAEYAAESAGAVRWEAWTVGTKQTLVLDADEKTGKATAECCDVYRTEQEIFQEMERDTSLSENEKQQVISEVLNGRWFSKGKKLFCALNCKQK